MGAAVGQIGNIATMGAAIGQIGDIPAAAGGYFHSRR
jgi:hypothetical protein